MKKSLHTSKIYRTSRMMRGRVRGGAGYICHGSVEADPIGPYMPLEPTMFKNLLCLRK